MSKEPYPFRFSHWMEDLSRMISEHSLFELSLPGSHNSGAFALSSSLAPGTPAVYGLVPGFIKRWSSCQDRAAHLADQAVYPPILPTYYWPPTKLPT